MNILLILRGQQTSITVFLLTKLFVHLRPDILNHFDVEGKTTLTKLISVLPVMKLSAATLGF